VYKGRKKKDIEFFAVKRVAKSQKQRVHKEVRLSALLARACLCSQCLCHTHNPQPSQP
jgi:hypothetical protein